MAERKGSRFKPGQSGNPKGRPPGARNKATMAAAALLDGEAEALTRKAIELAIDGDTVALRLCLERIAPPRKDRPVVFDIPKLETAADAVKATGALIEAAASGVLTPSEAGELAKLLDVFTRAKDAQELEERLAKLEKAMLQ